MTDRGVEQRFAHSNELSAHPNVRSAIQSQMAEFLRIPAISHGRNGAAGKSRSPKLTLPPTGQ